MQEQTKSSILIWINKQLQKKKLSANNILDLKGGNLLLEVIHSNFPKKINLTKIYIKPKTNIEISQNFKYLSIVFKEMKWKKIEVEKFMNGGWNLERELIKLSTYLMKTITELKQKQNIIQTTRSVAKKVEENSFSDQNIQNASMISQQDEEKIDGLFNNIVLPAPDQGFKLKSEVDMLQKHKNNLLRKIIDIEHIANSTDNTQAAKNLIMKLLDS